MLFKKTKKKSLLFQKRKQQWNIFLCFISSFCITLPAQAFKLSKFQVSQKVSIAWANINPKVNIWHIIKITDKTQKPFYARYFHFENPNPTTVLTLVKDGLNLTKVSGQKKHCALWSQQSMHNITKMNFSKNPNPFISLCNGWIYLRLYRSSKTPLSLTEWGTDILRSTSFGESIISTVKPTLVDMKAEKVTRIHKNSKSKKQPDYFPESPLIQEKNTVLNSEDHQLGISIQNEENSIKMGQWYESSMHKSIYISLYTADLVPKHLLKTYKNRVNNIHSEELSSLIYVTAYDLSKFSLKYSVGTEQPPIKTPRNHQKMRYNKYLKPIGSVPPYKLNQAVSVFIGGFKSRHSTIKEGPFQGKTYGYIQNGVHLAHMSHGLATLSIDNASHVRLHAWSRADSQKNITVDARQNGVMLIENWEPSNLLNNYEYGNWSADAKGLRRSIRSGVCIQESKNKKYLIFMAFTHATPSSMVRVMQSYSCKNAMHLDMNALMYVHNALFKFNTNEQKLQIEYLHQEMLYPPTLQRHRYVMDNNRRDFFYLTKKNQ
ncbi:MAG: hypothetical protein AB8C84_04705 [Oligoflexales bacterium]